MFPAGTNLPSSKALPAVWSDRAGFEARAAAYADAARLLAEAAQSGDRAAFLARWTAVRATCARLPRRLSALGLSEPFRASACAGPPAPPWRHCAPARR